MQVANRKTIGAMFVIGSLILPFTKPLRAQELPKQEINVSDDELRAFAKVYVQVDKIRQEYEPRVKEAKDPEESRQIQTEAANKMQEAAAKEGMTSESYRHIFELTNADETVRNKVIALINKEKEKS